MLRILPRHSINFSYLPENPFSTLRDLFKASLKDRFSCLSIVVHFVRLTYKIIFQWCVEKISQC